MENTQRTSRVSLPLALAAPLAALLAGHAFGQVEDTGVLQPQYLLISGDGQVGFGQLQLDSGDLAPYRWTSAGGVELLPNPLATSGYDFSAANAGSDDGSVVVGYGLVDPLGANLARALRWDAAGSVTELTPAAGDESDAYQISGDGSVAAGIYRSPGLNWHACVWDAAGTLTDVHPSFGGSYSVVSGLSYDGSTVLGRGTDAAGDTRHFVWTAATGSVELPPTGAGQIYPESIAADGSVIAGRIDLAASSDFGIFYWSAATGYIVADPAIGEPSQAKVSRDGSRVYGLVELGAGAGEAIFTWTPAAGFQFDQPGMELELWDGSFDGSVLVGSMRPSAGAPRAYRWTSATGFVQLPAPYDSLGLTVSLDGSVVSSTLCDTPEGNRSVVWSESGRVGASYCGPSVPNSTGVGAEIQLSGSNISSLGALTLTATSLPQSTFGFFIASNQPGFVVAPGGSFGNLCLAGGVLRLDGSGQIFNSGASGAAAITIDPSSFNGPSGPVLPSFGERFHFQAWFRDANPTVGSNFTDGATVPIF